MSAVVGIDPGVRACGVSAYIDKRLYRATLVKNSATKGQSVVEARAMACSVSQWLFNACPLLPPHFDLFVECPMVYGATFQKGNQNTSIIPLALVVGAIVAQFSSAVTVHQYAPREWKGTMDPDAAIDLIKARLSPDEHTRVFLPAPSLAHNVWDSVGIGLKALGRFEPKRVFARES